MLGILNPWYVFTYNRKLLGGRKLSQKAATLSGQQTGPHAVRLSDGYYVFPDLLEIEYNLYDVSGTFSVLESTH